jgi:hypothetical protein
VRPQLLTDQYPDDFQHPLLRRALASQFLDQRGDQCGVLWLNGPDAGPESLRQVPGLLIREVAGGAHVKGPTTMLGNVLIEMMSSEFILWRCLHGGPLTKETVDQPEPHPRVPWDQLRARNLPLLGKLTEVYGSCAVIARDGRHIIGQLRFYPKAVCQMAAPGPGMCMQQTFPNGPADDLVGSNFPPLEKIADKTLFVHCMMTGSPQQKDNPCQRKGFGSRMVRTLIDWARGQGWNGIEASAYADLPCLYAVTGQAGRTFWEKLGFRVIESGVESAFVEDGNEGFVKVLLKEATDRGMDAVAATTKYTMRLDLI